MRSAVRTQSILTSIQGPLRFGRRGKKATAPEEYKLAKWKRDRRVDWLIIFVAPSLANRNLVLLPDDFGWLLII